MASAAESDPREPFRERTAVITGGASGIGLAMARAFAARGARLVLADVDAEALARAERELAAQGADVLAILTDVTRRESVAALAERAFERFGAIHLLCNNAGIAVAGPLVGADPGDWQQAMAINFWGVVHGIDAFLPRMLAQGQGGHVVNTSSMAGLVGMDSLGIYCATKFAVVGLSEALQRELKPAGVGVSVLCPMIVATNINENSVRMRPAHLRNEGEEALLPSASEMKGGTIPPEEVGRRVVRAIERKDLYVLTHPEQRDFLRRRAAKLDAMFAPETW